MRGSRCTWTWARFPTTRGYWVCNTVWLLDDFTTDNGATRMVPGSHRWGTRPQDVLGGSDGAASLHEVLAHRQGRQRGRDERPYVARRNREPDLGAAVWRCTPSIAAATSRSSSIRSALAGDQAGLTPSPDILALDDPRNDEMSAEVTVRSGFMK